MCFQGGKQIFMKLFIGKTIMLDVMASDTIGNNGKTTMISCEELLMFVSHKFRLHLHEDFHCQENVVEIEFLGVPVFRTAVIR